MSGPARALEKQTAGMTVSRLLKRALFKARVHSVRPFTIHEPHHHPPCQGAIFGSCLFGSGRLQFSSGQSRSAKLTTSGWLHLTARNLGEHWPNSPAIAIPRAIVLPDSKQQDLKPLFPPTLSVSAKTQKEGPYLPHPQWHHVSATTQPSQCIIVSEMLRFTHKSQARVLYCCGCTALCNLSLHPPGTTTVVTEFDMGKYARSAPTHHPPEIPNLFIRVSDTEVEPSTATCQSCKSTFSRRHRVGGSNTP